MLEYTLSFGGVPFVTDIAQAFCLPEMRSEKYSDPSSMSPKDQEVLPDLEDELDRVQELSLINEFVTPSDYTGKNTASLASKDPANPKDAPSLRLYDFWYPNTATRWGVFRGLVTSSMAKAMLNATKGSIPQTFVMKCNPIAPNHSDSNVASYTISTSMYMLSCRPLREHGGGFDGLYLITLVDERYYFRKTASTTIHFHQLTTWDSLITQLASSLGIKLSYSAIPTAYSYPEPDSQLWSNYEDISVILDAIAFNIGRVVVRNLDGTYKLQSYLEAQSTVLINRAGVSGNLTNVTRLAGGDIFQSGNKLPAGDLFNSRNPVVPAQINFSFPKYIRGNDPVPHLLNTRNQPQRPSAWWEDSYGDVHRFTVPISSGGSTASGVSGAGNLSLHTTAKAIYNSENQAVSGGTPLNASGLNSLAYQMASDFYGWKLAAALDEVYPGIYNWLPEGIHDIIWTYSAKRRLGATRVIKSPWNQVVHEFQHSHYPLSGYTNIPIGVGGKTVALTVRDNISSGAANYLNQTMNSGDFVAHINTGFGIIFPQANRWRGQIENELIYFEGLSGLDTAVVVYRGIDGTIQTSHPNNSQITEVVPHTAYGTNLLTFGKGFTAFPQSWTSGGINESIVDVNLANIQIINVGKSGAGGGGGGPGTNSGTIINIWNFIAFEYININNPGGVIQLNSPKLRFTAGQTSFIDGFSNIGGAQPYDGQLLYLWNTSPFQVTIRHLSAGAAANFQVIVPNHEDYVLYPDYGCILEYDGTSLKWRFDTPGLFMSYASGGATGLVPSPNTSQSGNDYLAADRTWKQLLPEGPAEVTWWSGYVQKAGTFLSGQVDQTRLENSGVLLDPYTGPSVGLGVLDFKDVTGLSLYPKLTIAAQESQLLGAGYTKTAIPVLQPTNGELLIGGNGDGFGLNTLTPGTNIVVTNLSGNITIATTAVNSGYDCSTLYSGVLTVVTAVSCSGGTLSVTTNNFTWNCGRLISVV